MTRDDIINFFIAPTPGGEYTNLKARFLQSPPPCAPNLPYTPPAFPSPPDPHYDTELFVWMLYHYGLNRCPDPGGYGVWVSALVAGASIGGVVTDFLFYGYPTNEFFQGSTWYPNGHKGDLDNLLLAVNPSTDPYASAVWFRETQQGGPTRW